jgi:hypothetical protein
MAYTTSPLQSNPPGAAPPHRYGWPSMARAPSTIRVRLSAVGTEKGGAEERVSDGTPSGVGRVRGAVAQAARPKVKATIWTALSIRRHSFHGAWPGFHGARPGVNVVAKAAPTMPASERSAPIQMAVSQ